MNYLEHEEQLSPQQFGFRRARSTTDALVRLTDDVFSAYREKQHLVGVFFDLEKAYDTTWRFGILRAMHECGNICTKQALIGFSIYIMESGWATCFLMRGGRP